MAANKKLAADDAAGAEALMRQGLARDPDDHHLMEVLVRALIEQDRGAEAVPLARKIVKKRSKRVPYRLLLGDALLMVGDQAGARARVAGRVRARSQGPPGAHAPGHLAQPAPISWRRPARFLASGMRRIGLLRVRAALGLPAREPDREQEAERLGRGDEQGHALGSALASHAAGRSDLPRALHARRTRTGARRSRSPTAR